MIKIEMNNKKASFDINGNIKEIATDFRTIFETLYENDLVFTTAINVLSDFLTEKSTELEEEINAKDNSNN